MPKFSVIVAVHHEIIIEGEDAADAEAKALALADEVFDAFDLSTEGCAELADDDDTDLTTAIELRMG